MAGEEALSKPEELVLRPSRRKWLLVLLASAAFVLIGAWMITVGGPVRRAPFGDARFWGFASVIFFGLGIPLSLFQLFSSRSFLSLTAAGFTIGTIRGPHMIRWADVNSFTAEVIVNRWPLKPMQLVKFDYAPGFTSHRKMRGLARALSGHDAGLPDTYGMQAEELAALMNRWRERHAPSSG